MRQQDKQVDGSELEREERLDRGSDLVAEDEEELREPTGAAATEREERHTRAVVGALHAILGREHVVLEGLELSRLELRALEAVQTAAVGRDPQIDGFVYAEDRRVLLEQALAVLQPDLASLQQQGGVAFETLLRQVAELREQLGNLEDAQEEVEAVDEQPLKDEGDTDDEEDEDGEDDEGADLGGGDDDAADDKATTLGDPQEIAEAARPPWWKRS